MKLSEAIRMGAKMKPQGFGGDSIAATDVSCALGAAADAIGLQRNKNNAYSRLETIWPFLRGEEIPGPCKHHKSALLIEHIWMLNDNGNEMNLDKCWTREDIADWVELVEDDNGWGKDT